MIGKNLLKARLRADITQKDLAYIVGQDVSAISKWENDRRVITLDNLILLCKVLNVSADKLLGIKKVER